MIQRPRLKAHFRAESVPGGGVFLLSEDAPLRLEGRVFEQLTGLLDGHSTADEIAARLGSQTPPAYVYYALSLLEQRGYVEEAGGDFAGGKAVFWAYQGADAKDATRRLDTTTVSVASCGGLEREPLLELLKSMRVRVGERGALRVVLTDDLLRPELEAFNSEALEDGRAWLLVKPVGLQLSVGPLFRPGATGCWVCLAQRLRGNREVEIVLQQSLGRAEPLTLPRAETAATLQTAYGLAAMEIAKWVVRGALPELEGRVISFDTRSCVTQTHALIRQPFCTACRDAPPLEGSKAEPVLLRSLPKKFTADGGHRTCTPEETLEKYGHHISPITGLVCELKRRDVSGEGLTEVYFAGDNKAAPRQPAGAARLNFRSKSAGKGVTSAQSKASALCEALERHCGYFQGYEARRRGTLRALGARAIHPALCTQYSERQYSERDLWNARQSRFNTVPLPFDEGDEIDWTPVWSMTHETTRYLPTAFCYFAYPAPPERTYFVPDSNGNAAGNTLEEAILQGFLELAERDALGIWWYNRVRRPPVEFAAFKSDYPARLQTFLGRNGRDLWALDLTNDLGIPVFGAFSRRVGAEQERIVMGFGAHLDPEVAILRALTELNQMLTWVLPAERGERSDDIIKDAEALSWLRTATLANQSYLTPDESMLSRPASLAADDLRADVLFCRALVESMGLEMLVLDQTRPDVGLPVVKVVVPGLRHCHARLAPGRLYDVPAALGWLPAPLSEEQLNPVPLFL